MNDVAHDLMVAAAQATREGYIVILVGPDRWVEWFGEGQIGTPYEPMEKLGWENFIVADSDVVVRFEVTE